MKTRRVYGITPGGRRIRKGFRGSLGPIAVDGPTAKDAREATELAVLHALQRLDAGVLFGQWPTSGDLTDLHLPRAYIVFPTLEGWAYWLQDFSPGYVCSGFETRPAAERSAVNHMAQNRWSHELDDEVFLASVPTVSEPGPLLSDLQSWIQWQRRYQALRDEGKTHNEAYAGAHYL